MGHCWCSLLKDSATIETEYFVGLNVHLLLKTADKSEISYNRNNIRMIWDGVCDTVTLHWLLSYHIRIMGFWTAFYQLLVVHLYPFTTIHFPLITLFHQAFNLLAREMPNN